MSTLAILTGASRGIGAGTATAARADGADVATCDRSGGDPLAADHLRVDLSDPSAWPVFADWLDAVVDGRPETDRIVFVHHSATLTPIGYAGEVDPAVYRTNVLLNSAAPQILGDAVIRTARRTGIATVVVQISSGAARADYPGWSSYGAAKAAVDRWVSTVGVEQASRGDSVRVVSVAPGVVATDMQAEIRSSDSTEFPEVERFRTLHHDDQLADPGEVGSKIWALALASDWANGAVVDLRNR